LWERASLTISRNVAAPIPRWIVNARKLPDDAALENKNTFGLAADDYRAFRPTYPDALFAYLASLCERRHAALDCATGSGQAAVDLARYFQRVAAFDSSAEQVAAALPHPKIEYRVASAEALPYGGREFDLVTVAQGAHWFDLPRFYAEVRRVAAPGAIIAIWGYSWCVVNDEVDRIVAEHLLEPIAPFWAAGNRVIMEKYRTIDFPFDELPWPGFTARHEWTRAAFLNYMRTWSAYKRYVAVQSADPMPALDRMLTELWPDAATKPVTFELVGRVGRV
jgi:ubiquinone/menaquinone biosynthesis C-methylase UbiE